MFKLSHWLDILLFWPGPASKVPFSELGRWMRDDWRTYAAVIGGMCMKAMMLAVPVTWNATFLHRQFGWDLSRIGIIGAIAINGAEQSRP